MVTYLTHGGGVRGSGSGELDAGGGGGGGRWRKMSRSGEGPEAVQNHSLFGAFCIHELAYRSL